MNLMTTRKIDVTFVISQEKFYKRKDKHLKITHKVNISYGITFSTLLPFKEKMKQIIQDWSIIFHRSITDPMKKWMFHGYHQKESLSLKSENKLLN
jgi:hypothetical protein